MGEQRTRPNQIRYVCGNPTDNPVLNIRSVPDTLLPQEKNILDFRPDMNGPRESLSLDSTVLTVV